MTAIKAHLHEHNLNEYQSLDELINFQKDYVVTRQQIISKHELLIEREKKLLSVEVVRLEDFIKAKRMSVKQVLTLNLKNLKQLLEDLPVTHYNIIQSFISYIKKIWLKLKIQFKLIIFNFRVAYSIKHLVEDYNKKKIRYEFVVLRPEDAVMQSCLPQLHELEKKKIVIDQINNLVYGALGEQKVVSELEILADDCILINDFVCKFHPSIYNQKESDYIKSVQIDHILITPAGVFLIETKNWSQNSINNPILYSPVQQIKRANFALYKILNGKFFDTKLTLKKHHWGDRKIPIRNLIVFINHKPIEEFQYVKILTLNNLLSYANYFKPCFSNDETQMIANHLLKISVNI
ncbi:MAG: nuclease-related domain-containing protein [Mucilaginibacter sp.]